MGNLVPIASVVMGSNTFQADFTNIPQGYTDLVIRYTARGGDNAVISTGDSYVNGAGWTGVRIIGGNTTVATSLWPTMNYSGGLTTTNTYSSGEFYISNYTLTGRKPISANYCIENNSSSAAYEFSHAFSTNTTTAITSISFQGGFIAGSSWYLYGVL